MSAFDKLLEKRPEAIVGYNIGVYREQRDEWMGMARKAKFRDVRSYRVRIARERNKKLVQAMKTL